MATAETLDIVARDLELINALSSAAENLAIRSTVEGISAAERAALRNKAKTANEQAGALLTRGTVEIFSDPPDDALKEINDALIKTQETLESIKKSKESHRIRWRARRDRWGHSDRRLESHSQEPGCLDQKER